MTEKESCLEIELLKREVDSLSALITGMVKVGERVTLVERKLDKWTGIFMGVWVIASIFWGGFGGMVLSSLTDSMKEVRKMHDDVLIAVQRIGAIERAIDSRDNPAFQRGK